MGFAKQHASISVVDCTHSIHLLHRLPSRLVSFGLRYIFISAVSHFPHFQPLVVCIRVSFFLVLSFKTVKTCSRYSLSQQKDAYRKRFDTSDAIILPMVQKGKVEETILESIPQLAIQLLNTWFLGQLQSMPPLTVFSVSLSITSLTNTMWYYAYWNLFRCMQIRDVPCTLSLYNYKLSGVTDGILSFSKLSHEIAEIEQTEIEKLKSVTIIVNEIVINDDVSNVLNMERSPASKNIMDFSSEPADSCGAASLPTGKNPVLAIVDEAAEKFKMRPVEQSKVAALSELQRLKKQIACMQEENRRMQADMKRLNMTIASKLQSSTAPVSAKVPDQVMQLGSLAVESANGDSSYTFSQSKYCVMSAAVIIQSVTRGHLDRLRFKTLNTRVTMDGSD
jgi:hypothetical protein